MAKNKAEVIIKMRISHTLHYLIKLVLLFIAGTLSIGDGYTSEITLDEIIGSLPVEYGKVSSRSSVEASKTLVIIEDVHNNLSVQYNIASILEHVTSRSDIHAVYLEGASGVLSPADYFEIFPDEKLTASITELLLKTHFITGTEYFSLSADNPVVLKGAEVYEDYRRNRESLQDIKSSALQNDIEQLINHLNDTIRNERSLQFQELDERYMTVALKSDDLGAFIQSVNTYYSLDILSSQQFPVLSHIRSLSENADEVNQFAAKGLATLEKQYPDDVNVLESIARIKKVLWFKGDQTGYLKQAHHLFSQYPDDLDRKHLAAIEDFLSHLDAVSSLPPTELYLSILKSYEMLYQSGHTDSEVFELRKFLIGMYKGSTINLTPHERAYFNLDAMSVNDVLSVITKHTDISAPQLVHLTDVLVKINTSRTHVGAFYDAVEKRNKSIVSTISDDVPDGKTAVLVVGGYHKSIEESFSANGFYVCVVTPNIEIQNSSVRNVTYSDYVSGILSSVEKSLYYAWSTIIAPIISQKMAQFIARENAIPAIAARQLGVMTGSALVAYQDMTEEKTQADTKAHIELLQKPAIPVNESLTRAFGALQGTESLPQWPVIHNVFYLTQNKGVITTFKLGNTSFVVRIVKQGRTLSLAENFSISALESQRLIETSIRFDGETFDVVFSSTDGTFEDVDFNDQMPWLFTVNQDSVHLQGIEFLRQPAEITETVRDTVQTWEKIPINRNLADDIGSALNELDRTQSTIQTELNQTFGDEDNRYSDGLTVLRDVLANLKRKSMFIRQNEPLQSLTFNVPSDSRPIALSVVSSADLAEFNTSILTVPYDDRIEIYVARDAVPSLREPGKKLQSDFIRKSEKPTIPFIQLLKRELDRNVLNVSHDIAVLLESLLNTNELQKIGAVSDAMIYEIDIAIVNASEDVEQLYQLDNYFKDYLAAKQTQRAVLSARTDVSAQEKHALITLLENLERTILDKGKDLETAIIRAGGEVGGFQFFERLGTGGFGSVYLAGEANTLYAVKIPDSRRAYTDIVNEAVITQEMYGDVQLYETGIFGTWIVIPYFDGTDLNNALTDPANVFASETEMLDMAISLTSDFVLMAGLGIRNNDIQPGNIYIPQRVTDARIIDFGSARRAHVLPRTLDQARTAFPPNYVSPEGALYRDIIWDLDMLVIGLGYIKDGDTDFLKRIIAGLEKADNYISNRALHEQLKEKINGMIQTGYTRSPQDIFTDLEPDIAAILYSMLDERSDIFSFGRVLEVLAVPELKAITDRALAKDKKARYQSFQELYTDLVIVRNTMQDGSSAVTETAQKSVSADVKRRDTSVQSARNITQQLEAQGMLAQDIDILQQLSPDQHISGDFGDLTFLQQIEHGSLHSGLLNAYLANTLNAILEKEQLLDVYTLFIESLQQQTGSAETANSIIAQMKTHIKQTFNSSIPDGAAGNVLFIKTLIIEYFSARFNDEHQMLFSDRIYAALNGHLRNALPDYNQLYFSSDNFPDTPGYRADQITYIQTLFARAGGQQVVSIFPVAADESVVNAPVTIPDIPAISRQAVDRSL